MLRVRVGVGSREFKFAIGSLALVLATSVSPNAMAACNPSSDISSSVTGSVNCDASGDTVNVTGGSTVLDGNIDTDGGADTVNINAATVTGNVTTGNGGDEVNIEGNGTIQGDLSTGNAADIVTVTHGNILGDTHLGGGVDSFTLDAGLVGNIDTGNGSDLVTVNGGTVSGNVVTGDGGDLFSIYGGTVDGNVQMGANADDVYLFGGTIEGNIITDGGSDTLTIDLTTGEPLELGGGQINLGAGSDELTIIGASNLEEDDENIEIEDPAFVFNGGGGDDILAIDDSEVRFGDVINFELLSVEQSVVVLTGEEYEFGEASDPAFSGPDQIAGIKIDAGSQLWFTEAEEVEAPHIAVDTDGTLMFGAYPASGDDDDDDDADDAEPVATTVILGDAGILNAGTIGTFNGVAGDTVTFTGGGYQSVGGSGRLAIDTVLGGSDSTSDVLNFDETKPFSGTTTVYVNNVGGQGGFTGQGANDGILIATGPDDFGTSLQLAANTMTGQQEVLAGAFSYRLVSNDNAAMLQSDVMEQVPGYAVVSSVAQRYAYAELGTLYNRIGEVRLGHSAGTGAVKAGGWVRGLYSDQDVAPDKGYDFTQQSRGVMLGADVLNKLDGGKLLAGLFGGYGSADADTSAVVWGQNAASRIDMTAWTVGGYGTYYEGNRPGVGYYFDGVFKANILDFDMSQASRGAAASTDGYSAVVSGEAGYGLSMGPNLTLLQQAQLSYTTVSITNYADNYGINVGNGNSESLIGRASLQLQGNFGSPRNGWVSPYAIASVLSDFLGDNETRVGSTDFSNDVGLTWYELGGGVTAELTQSVSFYGSAEYSFGDIEGWSGTGGIKARW